MRGRHKTVAVVPAGALDARRRLFEVLETAFPVRFVGRAPEALRDVDAVLAVGKAPAAAELPTLNALAPEPESGVAPRPYELSRDRSLDTRLRGQRLADPGQSSAVPAERGVRILAGGAAGPLWVHRPDVAVRSDIAALVPAELGPEEGLRERLTDQRSLALLPLVHFLRELTAELNFEPPPPRAAFILDDPNLHWTSYGHVRYRDLAEHANRHGYHAAMAMVPLDGWLTHPGAARLFRMHSERLSLLYHGNDHVLQELARPRKPGAVTALLAQALRRMAAFEKRSGVRVARVMTPPHGDCSQEMARAMLRLGFEGLCIGRPYPWVAREGDSWLARPDGTSPLVSFGPSTLVTGGLPVILRRPFEASEGELALMAFLDQPLVIYGHHQDLAEGFEPLAAWAERVRDIAPARWLSLREIAATNHMTRLEGELLRIRMHGRRARVELPTDARRVRVELPQGHDDIPEQVACGAAIGRVDAEIELPFDEHTPLETPRTVEIQLIRGDALAPSSIPRPTWTPWPIVRRAAGEGRDRVASLYLRATRKPVATASEGFPAESNARAIRR